MIVVDASAVVQALLATDAGRPIAERLLDPAETLHAPHLLDVEVGQVLRRFTLSGQVTPDRARLALDDLADLPLQRYGHTHLLSRAWQHRHNVTFYDAIYLALAEALAARLVTRDARLARAAGDLVRVEFV